MLVRLFGRDSFGRVSWLKWFLCIFTVLQLLACVVVIVLMFTQVTPIQRLWIGDFPDDRKGQRRFIWSVLIAQGTLSSAVHFYISMGGLSRLTLLYVVLFTISNFTYVLFPILLIWRLQMPLHRKMGIGIMLALSLITMAASIMKIVTFIAVMHPQDFNNAVKAPGTSTMWSSVEQSLSIIMPCMPLLGPISRWDLKSRTSRIVATLAGRRAIKRPPQHHSLRRPAYRSLNVGNRGHGGKFWPSDLETGFNGASTCYREENEQDPGIELGENIVRTHEVTITYEQNLQPLSEVPFS